MKKIYLAKYMQSRFGNLGNSPIESMIQDAGSEELDDVDLAAVEHIAIAGLLAPKTTGRSRRREDPDSPTRS